MGRCNINPNQLQKVISYADRYNQELDKMIEFWPMEGRLYTLKRYMRNFKKGVFTHHSARRVLELSTDIVNDSDLIRNEYIQIAKGDDDECKLARELWGLRDFMAGLVDDAYMYASDGGKSTVSNKPTWWINY